MKRLLLLTAFGAGLLATPRADAQVLDPARFDVLFSEEPTVEVNLQGSLLRLAAAATREDEPETAALIDGLNAITVRIYPLSSALADLSGDLGDVGHNLEADGWSTFVRVRDGGGDEGENGDVWIYVRETGDVFGGLVVMALDPDEDSAAFVLIDGEIAPDDIGRLSSRFGSVNLNLDDDEETSSDDEN
jgi:hypothetical protein